MLARKKIRQPFFRRGGNPNHFEQITNMLRQARTAGSVTLCRKISLTLKGGNGPITSVIAVGVAGPFRALWCY